MPKLAKTQYAVYEKDEFIMIGNMHEISTRLNVKPKYVSWLATICRNQDKYKDYLKSKKRVIVRIEEDEDE